MQNLVPKIGTRFSRGTTLVATDWQRPLKTRITAGRPSAPTQTRFDRALQAALRGVFHSVPVPSFHHVDGSLGPAARGTLPSHCLCECLKRMVHPAIPPCQESFAGVVSLCYNLTVLLPDACRKEPEPPWSCILRNNKRTISASPSV